MRLTKQTSQALRILLHCARLGRQTNAGEIARATLITEHNVAKLVALLVQGGFLKTMRGRTGGVRLACTPAEIHLGDVVRLTEATSVEADCFGETIDCSIRPLSPVNRIFSQALGAFTEVLDQHTLEDLMVRNPGQSGDAGDEIDRLTMGVDIPRMMST
ncbi:RrF2 family transcriptional regulator [Afifella sp. H1R]|uniref:RrF2 family transcriptional regulator n=1 Tax=unclassified Afifella TaxID=2624128 RepID=UPI001F15CF8C|nr:Rrf2 family transcriptional regulator [Afifella sp. H1R]MCF1503946.1 Rrf2 family transcriptional regulator [Afifella sp. H1R]